MRPAGAEGDAGVAALEELTALEELVAAVVAVLAVVIPALHAARDKLAAQAARATAAGRYLFIVVLKREEKMCCAKPRQAPCPAYGERVASLRHPAQSRHGSGIRNRCRSIVTSTKS
jgi:hypothetical protein